MTDQEKAAMLRALVLAELGEPSIRDGFGILRPRYRSKLNVADVSRFTEGLQESLLSTLSLDDTRATPAPVARGEIIPRHEGPPDFVAGMVSAFGGGGSDPS